MMLRQASSRQKMEPSPQALSLGFFRWGTAMRLVRLCRQGACTGVVILAISASAAQVNAQNPPQVEIVTNVGHSNGLSSVAFSPDGSRVLSGCGSFKGVK
jgi:hypothetical protein